MKLPKAELEYWMREFYFSSQYDLGSSGVAPYTYSELAELVGINYSEIANISLGDSLTLGSEALRKSIANRWGDGNIENIMVANGSSEMLYIIMTTMLNEGDEVVILDPIYHALSIVAITAKCHTKRWKLDPENQFEVNMEELNRLLSSKTKMVVVNFPNNPSGVSLSNEQFGELLESVARVNAYLVWDAAFEDLCERPLPNPYFEYKKSISIGTLSKAYGLPGLRVGWCFADPELLKLFVQQRDHTTLFISPLIEQIAEKAIIRADILLNERFRDVRANIARLNRWINSHEQEIEWSNPIGGVTGLMKFSGVNDNEHFCRELARTTGVMLVPGSCFGYPEFVRFGYGAGLNEFEVGIERLTNYLESNYW